MIEADIELDCKKCSTKFSVPLFTGQVCTSCGFDNAKKEVLACDEQCPICGSIEHTTEKDGTFTCETCGYNVKDDYPIKD